MYLCVLLDPLSPLPFINVTAVFTARYEQQLSLNTRAVHVTDYRRTGLIGFPLSSSKCLDGSQNPKLPLHVSHAALLIYIHHN